MVEGKKDKSQKNKGVSTSKEPVKGNTYFSDTDSYTQSLNPTKSLNKVKNELQTVIDLMGPHTPHFNQTTSQTTSNNGDNEESVLSNTSIKFLKASKTDDDVSVTYTENSTDKTAPPDITLQEETDLSKIADKNSTTLNLQDVECPQYICPPPLLPANVMFNSECMCPQMATYIHQGAFSVPCIDASKEVKKCPKHRNIFYSLFKNLKEKQHDFISGKREYYSMNIKRSGDDYSPPRRLVFDLVGDVPEYYDECGCKIPDEIKETCYTQTRESMKSKESKRFSNDHFAKENLQNENVATPLPKESVVNFDKNGRKFHQKTTYSDYNGTTRVDVYYFDHGNSSYLKTTDSAPAVMTEAIAERTEAYTTRFWAEIFGTLHIGISFGTSFVLQLFRFVLYSFLRPLTIGFVQLGSDYFFKPCIATVFNAVIQPPLIFLYNVATSIRDVCDPVAEGAGYFLREIANVIRAFRIIETRKDKCTDNKCKREKEALKEKNNVIN